MFGVKPKQINLISIGSGMRLRTSFKVDHLKLKINPTFSDFLLENYSQLSKVLLA